MKALGALMAMFGLYVLIVWGIQGKEPTGLFGMASKGSTKPQAGSKPSSSGSGGSGPVKSF